MSTTVIEVEIDADRERQREKDMDADTYIDEKGIPRRKSADALRKSKEAAVSKSDRPTPSKTKVKGKAKHVGVRSSTYRRRGTPDLNISMGIFDAPKFVARGLRETALKQTMRFVRQEFEQYCDIGMVLTPPKTGQPWSGWEIVKALYTAGVDTEMIYSRDCKYVALVARVTQDRLIDAVGVYNAQGMQYDPATRAATTFDIIAQPKGRGGAGLTKDELTRNKQVLSTFPLH